MKLYKFPIIFITIGIIGGILLGNYIQIGLTHLVLINFLVFLLLYLSHKIANNKINFYSLFSFILIFNSILLGLLLQKRIDKRNFSNHYSHLIDEEKPNYVTVKLIHSIKPTSTYQRYIGEVININKRSSFGKILIKNKETAPSLNPGVILNLYINSKDFVLPKTSTYPFEFDYQKYLLRKGIYHQIFLNKIAWRIKEKSSQLSLQTTAEKIRLSLIKNLKNNHLKGNELALASALFLGERQFLNQVILSDFQSAGTIHILAISGLHIGILLIFLNFIFGFIKRKAGKIPFLIITLSILWMYAFITGLSPSVLRAVIMFSLLQITQQLKRESNIFNTLFSAAFLMILFNPAVIYQIGFQMSFAAVLSIVSFFPIFSKFTQNLFQPAKWIAELFWVSLAAQIGVLPLSLYYFHQFPIYFLLANLLVIPLLFIILFYGFILIPFSLSGLKLTYIFKVLSFLLELLLHINHKIASLEKSLITDIYFDKFLLFIIFIGILLFFQLIKHKLSFKNLAYFLTWIIFLQVYLIGYKFHKKQEHKLFFLNQYKTNLLAESQGNHITFYQKKSKINPYILKGFLRNYKFISFDPLQFFQEFNEIKILHIDSLGIWNFKKMKPDIVSLHHSPKINLEKMIDQLHPKIIIADGSNYPQLIKKWKTTIENQNIQFIDLNKKGAYILDSYKLLESKIKGSKSAKESDL